MTHRTDDARNGFTSYEWQPCHAGKIANALLSKYCVIFRERSSYDFRNLLSQEGS